MTLREGRDGLAPVPASSSLRVLIVADQSTDADLVRALLAGRFPHAQFELAVEVGLSAALSRLSAQRFDVILVDGWQGDSEVAVAAALRTAHPETSLLFLSRSTDGHLDLWARLDPVDDLRTDSVPDMSTAIVNVLQGNLAEDRAHRYLDLARGLLDALDAPTCAVDADGRIVAINVAWRHFTHKNGGTDDRCGVGVSYLDACDRADTSRYGGWTPDAAAVATGIRRVIAGELELFRHDYACHSPHENRWCSAQVTPATINGGPGAVITHLDTTNLREIERTLAFHSMHDALTKLPNRSLLVDRMEQAIADAERRGLGVAVAHLDLSGFRRVNEMLQYSGGDAVLLEVADRLLSHLRPGDTLARASGADFLVLWRDLAGEDPAEGLARGEGLLRVLEEPFGTAHVPVQVTACVGIARHTRGWDVERTLSSAHLAVADAKTRGAGNVVVFTQELEEAVVCRTTMETELRAALTGTIDQFVLHYQPVVDLATGHVVAVEALVRWEHPARGRVAPDRFIAMAEAMGLIHALGGWVLDQAVRDAAVLTHQGRELDIAVNFSVLQLDERTVTRVQQALESVDMRPGRLIVEVTESALAENEDTVVQTLEALSELGVSVAIDDFGTGYSSLHYLRRYPIDTIKIDREFVAGVGEPADDEAICESIVHLASAVGATTIGEGIETAEQYAFLRGIGCQQGQGYLWSAPVPVEDLPAAIAACGEVPLPPVRPRGAPLPPVRPREARTPEARRKGRW